MYHELQNQDVRCLWVSQEYLGILKTSFPISQYFIFHKWPTICGVYVTPNQSILGTEASLLFPSIRQYLVKQ